WSRRIRAVETCGSEYFSRGATHLLLCRAKGIGETTGEIQGAPEVWLSTRRTEGAERNVARRDSFGANESARASIPRRALWRCRSAASSSAHRTSKFHAAACTDQFASGTPLRCTIVSASPIALRASCRSLRAIATRASISHARACRVGSAVPEILACRFL